MASVAEPGRRVGPPRDHPIGGEEPRRWAGAIGEVGEDAPDDRHELEAVPREPRADDDRADPVEHEVLVGRRRVGAADRGGEIGVDARQPVARVALQRRQLVGNGREVARVGVDDRPDACQPAFTPSPGVSMP